MGLFDIFKKKKKSAELDGVVTERLFNTSNQGCNTDEIPEGTGEFGLDSTNPIPVNGIWENETYLGKLYRQIIHGKLYRKIFNYRYGKYE